MLVNNFASQCNVCEVCLAGEAMETEHRPLGHVPQPFLPAAAGRGPHAETLLPPPLSAPAEVGVALAQPPGTMVAFAGVWTVDGTVPGRGHPCRAEEGHPGPPWPGWPTVPLPVARGARLRVTLLWGTALGWRGTSCASPRSLQGKGHAVCMCWFPCVPSTCDQWEFPPEQLHAASRMREAHNQTGS